MTVLARELPQLHRHEKLSDAEIVCWNYNIDFLRAHTIKNSKPTGDGFTK